MATVSLCLIEKALQNYHTTIAQLRAQGVRSERGLRCAFAALLIEISKPKKWTLREEYSQKLSGHAIYYDGVLCDEYRLPHAY
jgi:hypothetical protein